MPDRLQLCRSLLFVPGSAQKRIDKAANLPADAIIFDLEDEVKKTSRTFSLNNTKQENILIEELKKNCRKLVKEKTGKKPYTNINLVRI